MKHTNTSCLANPCRQLRNHGTLTCHCILELQMWKFYSLNLKHPYETHRHFMFGQSMAPIAQSWHTNLSYCTFGTPNVKVVFINLEQHCETHKHFMFGQSMASIAQSWHTYLSYCKLWHQIWNLYCLICSNFMIDTKNRKRTSICTRLAISWLPLCISMTPLCAYTTLEQFLFFELCVWKNHDIIVPIHYTWNSFCHPN